MPKQTFTQIKKELVDVKKDLTDLDKTLKLRTLAVLGLTVITLFLIGVIIL